MGVETNGREGPRTASHSRRKGVGSPLRSLYLTYAAQPQQLFTAAPKGGPWPMPATAGAAVAQAVRNLEACLIANELE